MNNSNSQSAGENSLVQFERLERQLNNVQQAPAAADQQRQHNPSIQEVDDEESLQLPAHEPFMRQGMGDDGGGDDLPLELSYQHGLLRNDNHSDNNDSPSISSNGAASNASSNERHTHSTPVPSSLSSSSLASRAPPKTTPRTTATTATITSLIAPLKVPDFKQDDYCKPQRPATRQRSPLQQLNVPNFKQNELCPPQTQQKLAFNSMQKARPMYQSTPHNQQKMLKPTTPNGHQISPIPEESELDQLVSALVDNHQQQQQKPATTAATIPSDQRAEKSLITQLRDVIAQWDWAQARHRHVAKIYFERQTDELNAKWEQLNAEITKFNEMKSDEWAQIAKVRSGLRAEQEKRLGKKEAERIIQLEKELAEFKAKDALASRRTCKLRTQNSELQGVVQVREQSYTENIKRIKNLESQLVSVERTNSNLRTRLELMRQERPRGQQQQQINQQLPNPHQQLRQQQQNLQKQQHRVVTFSAAPPVVVPIPSSNSSSTTSINTVHLQQQQEPTQNFRWESGSCGCSMAPHGTNEKVQVDYFHDEGLYEVRLPRGHFIRFMLNGHLELYWANGDRTLLLPDGERHELYSLEQSSFFIEIFKPTGIAYRLSPQTQWVREEFVPDPHKMSIRPDGSFAAKLAGEPPSLQINTSDFQLRRFADTNAIKLGLERIAGIQLWLCTDNVLLVKHVFRQSGNGNNNNNSRDERTTSLNMGANTNVGSNNTNNAMKKYLCFSLGRCPHINNI